MHAMKLFSLEGQVAIVTGGSRGLGLKMAEGLGQMGARLVLCARKEGELAAASEQLGAQGIEVVTVTCDLSDTASEPHSAIVDATMDRFGQVDILLNNAGISWLDPAEGHSLSGWNKVMRLNVDALFLLAQEVGRRSMIPRRQGKIINIASISGMGGNPPSWPMKTLAYNTSKGAVINMTRALACEWGEYNINVNAVAPGFFPSKMSEHILKEVMKDTLVRTPLARIGEENDLKGAAIFLASEASRHITGQVIAIDGGFSASY